MRCAVVEDVVAAGFTADVLVEVAGLVAVEEVAVDAVAARTGVEFVNADRFEDEEKGRIRYAVGQALEVGADRSIAKPLRAGVEAIGMMERVSKVRRSCSTRAARFENREVTGKAD